jgi:hypothetical protein
MNITLITVHCLPVPVLLVVATIVVYLSNRERLVQIILVVLLISHIIVGILARERSVDATGWLDSCGK